MKKALYLIGGVLGVGVVIWVVKMFSAKPAAQSSAVTNTGTAGALDAFYSLFKNGNNKSTGSQPDNTGALITAGGSVLTSTVKSLTDLLKGTPMQTPTAATPANTSVYAFDPTNPGSDFLNSIGMTNLTDSQLLYGINLEKP